MSVLLNPYRFSTGWTPPVSLTDVRGWWDSSYAGSVSTSGSNVTQWSDLSGNGNHFTQGTSTLQPTTTTDATSGRTVIVFDGTDDVLVAADSSSLDLTTGLAIYVVVTAITSGVFSKYLLTKNPLISSEAYGMYTASDGTSIRIDLNAFTGQLMMGHPWTGRHIFDGRYDKVTVRGHNDGTLGTSFSYTSNIVANTQPLYLGAKNASGNSALGFTIGELVICGTDTTGTEDTNLRSYLKTKWSTV